MKYKLACVKVILLALLIPLCYSKTGFGQTGKDVVLMIKKVDDFTIDGEGSAEPWSQVEWVSIPGRGISQRMSKNPAPLPSNPKINPSDNLMTRFKVLYSGTGIYFLVQCEDRILQATMKEDFKQIWWEDVFEIFLWTEEKDPTYFEYQISPLNHIRMTKHKKSGSSQLIPYENTQQILRRTSVEGGKKESEDAITQWMAEIYIPYRWLQSAQNNLPKSGTHWRANLYRFDYDTGDRTKWGWQPVETSNHQLEKFGSFLFE